MSKPIAIETWQRLSPWSIIYFIVRAFKNALDPNVLVMLAPLYGLYQFMEDSVLFVVIVALGIPAIIIGFAVLSYLFFKFRIDKDRFRIRKGFIFKRRVDLPFYRIQDIRIEKPIYFKPIGLVSAFIDTAGSNEDEAVLAAITHSSATQLRERIFNSHQHPASGSETAETPAETHEASKPLETLLLTRSIADLVIHGLANNKMWFIIAALFPVLNQAFEGFIEHLLKSIPPEITALAEASLLYLAAFILIGVLGIILVMMLLSVLGSILMLYDYKLTRNDERLRKESGLLNRHQVSLKPRRLQTISIHQGIIDRLFKRFNLYFNQISTQLNNPKEQGRAFLVPSIKETQITDICRQVYPELNLKLASLTPKLAPISKRFISQQMLLTTTPITAIIGFIIYMNSDQINNLVYLPLIFILGCGLNYRHWQKWGFVEVNGYLLIRRGLIGTVYHVFPTFKAQQIKLKQSLPMRYNNHCTLEILLGNSIMKIPYIPKHIGQELADKTLYTVESTQLSWM